MRLSTRRSRRLNVLLLVRLRRLRRCVSVLPLLGARSCALPSLTTACIALLSLCCHAQFDMLCKLILTSVLPLIAGPDKLILGMVVCGAYVVSVLLPSCSHVLCVAARLSVPPSLLTLVLPSVPAFWHWQALSYVLQPHLRKSDDR
jgi:hypothetical protein